MKNIISLIIFSLLFSACSPKIDTKIFQNIRATIAPIPTVIKPSGIPSAHLIKTAFIQQAPEKNWAEPWQDSCEEAALLTVKYYYSNTTPDLPTLLNDYQQMFSYEAQNNWSSDINLANMSQIAAVVLHLKPTIIYSPSVDEIKKYISLDTPVIVPANGKILFAENKRFKSGGPWYHNLVIVGYDDDHQQFIVHDVGTQFGAYFRYSYSLLMSSIHDFPSSGKKEEINSGDKNILVLLK